MSTRCYKLNRSSFWQRGWGIFLIFSLLAWNWQAVAQNYLLRYGNTAAGAVTFTGNTLGLNKANNVNGPGNVGSIGAFITLNTSLTGGTFGPGTTLNWSNNSSAAVLRMPTNSSVLYAELIWSGSALLGAAPLNSPSNILNYINLTNTVRFVLPNGTTNYVAPDPATANLVTNGTTAVFYIRSANVTALVQAGGAGTYSVGGVPATVAPLDNNNNACGWTLAVAYGNSSLHQRNMTIFVGNSLAAAGVSTPPVGVSGFCSPPTGAVNGYLYVSAVEGDAQLTGDQMLFGTTTNTLAVLSGPNNLSDNFFASQINYCQPDYSIWAPTLTNGTIDTSGTFGLSNSTPLAANGTEPISGARQSWDITCVNVSSALTNGVTSAFAENTSSQDAYVVNALALQIDVGSPVLTSSQSVDKASTYVGDTLTYTVTVTNSGTADAVNLIFTDPLPFGTSFVTNSFTTNGVVVAGANPVNGVPIPIIKQASNLTITYQVLVDQIPPSAQFITAATITFQYAGACAQSPIINGTLVNGNVQTLAPLLNVNKVSSLTNIIPGAALTYTINVPNNGATNTVGTTLIDQIPAGVTYVTNTTKLNGTSVPDLGGTNMPYTVATEINGPGSPAGVINVGASAIVTFQVKISTNPPTQINNTATIYANGTDPTTAQNAGANVAPVYSDLAVAMVGNPNPVAAGAPISYIVNVTNNGPNAVSIVTNFITLSLPLSASILSPVYTPSIGTYNPFTGVWSGISLPSNGVVTLTISGQVSPNTASGNILSSVTVTPPTGVTDTVTNNNSATASNSVVQVADLAMTISDGVTSAYQDQTLTYTITAINLGPSTLTSLTLSNSFSVFLTNLVLAPSVGYYNAANGVWNGLNLSAGDSATLTLTATVLSNVTGLFTNSVTGYVPAGVTDPILTNNTASDVDLALAIPDVGIIKTGPANVYAGTNYTYTLTITNSGLGIASNVVPSDVLPTNVTFVSASGGGTNNAGVVSWALTSLSPGVGTTLTLTVTAPTGGNVTNVATVTSSTPDSNPANNTSAPVGTTITPIADMAVGKTGPATVIANSNLTYTITVTNLGPSPAAGIVVADVLPTTGTFVSCAPAYSSYNAGALGWSLGTLSPGQVSNLTVIVKAPASGFLTNIAGVSTTTLDTNSVNNTSPSVISVVTTLASSADLGVTKTGPTNVFGGANFSYTITVTNSGPAAATNVVASDVLPTNVVFVSASGGGITNAGVANWVLGTLASGNATNVTITVKAPVAGVVTNIATVTSTTADPNSANNTSSPVVTSVTPAADVAIGKTGSASVFAASNLVYTISVTNFGPSSASAVVVTDALPTGVTFVSASGGGINNSGVVNWSLGTLTNGQTSNVTVTVTAPASGSLSNVATVSTPTGDPNLTNNLTPPVITTVTPVADVAIGKTGPASVFAASNLVYTISVTNFGPSSASAVVVTDSLPVTVTFVSASGGGINNSGVVNWSLGTLTNGQTSNVTVTVTAPASGSLSNVATVSTPTGDPNLTNNLTPPVITTVTPVADVAIGKTGPANVLAASNLVYTISVTNFGPSSASAVVVTDSLPVTVTFVSASGGGINNSGVVNWSLGTLTNGQTSNVTVTVTAPASGSLSNVATVSTPTGDPNLTNNLTPPVITTVTPVADVAIGKTGPANVLAASNLVYTISVTNFGPSSASAVVVTDALPTGVTFVSASGGGLNNSGVVNWSLGILTNGQTSNVTVTVTAPASGSLSNVATVSTPTGDPNLTNNLTPPVITTVTPVADVAIGKTGPANVLAASNLVYTISVTNFGPSSASAVVVTDALPTGVTFVSASGGGLNNSGVVNWSLGTLTNGQTSNVTVTVTAPASGSLSNVATVSTPTGDPNLTNNLTPPVITTVTPVADVAIGKTGPASVFAASNLVYTISVTNFGPSSASAVVVTDSLPVTVTFVSASGGGLNNSGVVNWSLGILTNGQTSNVTVTVTAPASGSLSNVATVSTPTGDPNLTNNLTPPVITTVTPVADVAIGKTGSASVFAASNLVYTISVTNFGPSSASAVVVTDALPTGVTFVSASGGGINNSGVVNWSLGTLTNGQTSNVTVTVTAPASGSLSNVATVSTPTGDPNLTNNLTPPVITTVTPVADVAIGKTGPASVFAASNLVYTISVTNFGPSSASAVVVTDSLPVTVTFVSASGGGINNSGVVNWSLGTLTNGQTSNVTVTVTAPASGSLSNVATVSTPTGDPNLTNNLTPPVITTVTPVADVAIGKTGPASVFAASNLVYTISVTNFGPSSASAVVVTDALPTGVTFVSASGGGLNNSGVVNWSLGILTNGQTSNVTVTVKAPAAGIVTNIAVVTSTTADANLGNNTSSPVLTSVTPVADVAIGKTGSASVFAASNLVYTISVTNFGPSSASAVVVTDALPTGVTFVSASGGGINNSGVVNWSLGTLANGQTSNVTVTVKAPAAGIVTNIAVVTSTTADANLGNNTSSPVLTTVTPVADVAIGKTGPASVFAASNLVYTISVTNFGPSSASAVVVTDSLPVTVTFVSASGGGLNNSGVVNWSLGTLTNGQTSNVTVTVTAPASGSLSNVATVSTPTGDPNLTNNLTPPVITTVTPVADVAIGKTGPASVFAASNLVYTISVTNFGPSSASAVVVTDSLPVTVTFVSASGGGINNSGVVNWSLGTLTNGQTSNVTVTVTAPASGSLSNVATVSTPTGDPNLTNNLTPPVITTVTPVADVAIGKTGPANVLAASNLVYTISVTNFGPSSASAVVVTDSLPVTVTFVSASGGGINNSGVVNWSLGTLANGQTSNVTVTVTAPASGSLSNVATVSTPTGDPNLTNNLTPPVITTVTPVADVAIGKTGPAIVSTFSNLVYTISVTNFGPSSASAVVVTDALPTGVTFVSASGGGLNNSGVVNWSLGILTNGQTSNVTVTVKAPAAGIVTNIAVVTSTTADANLGNNTSSPVLTSVTPVADVAIGKTGSASVFAASNLVYTISVTNFGPSSASAVVVTDALPTGVTFVSASGGGINNSGVVNWSLGTLANGQTSNVTVTVTAPASGSLSNVATVSTPTGDPNLTNNLTPPVITTVTPVADVAIGKTGSASVFAASNLVYTISVTNFGPSSASAVVVTDSLPVTVTFVSASGGGLNNSGVVNWSLGILTNGQTSNVTVTVTAPASGSLSNVATVSTPTGDPNLTNNLTPPVITTVTPVADVAIGKTGPASVFAASNLVYTISVTNFGPSSASAVVVTDSLPVTVTFVSASGGGLNNSGVVNWSLGILTNGQTSNVTVTVTAPASGSLSNVATVSTPTGDPNLTNNLTPPVITTVTPVADVAIGKTGPASVFAASNLVYTISVTNFGPSSASAVVVTDALPTGVTFVSASGGGLNNSGVVNWSLGILTNGQTSNVTVTVTAPASGSLSNVATVSTPTGDPNLTNNLTPPVITTVTPVADVAIGKTGPANVLAASNLVYTISVTNFGPSSASAVVVTDSLPVTVTFVSASGGGINNSGVVNWSLGTLANGQTSNVTVTVKAPAAGIVTNIAVVTSTTADANLGNNTSSPVLTTVTPVADVAIGKTGPASVFAASNLVYTISVTNFGPSSASAVVVTDSLPVTVTFVSASGGGINNSGVVNWSLGTLTNGQTSNVTVTVTAPASGSLSNVATVSTPTGDPNLTNNLTPPVITTVTPVADVAIGKTGSASVFAASNLVYTISVTNFGPSSASAVVVTDSLPVTVTFVSASGGGINNSGVVNWSLGILTNGQTSNVTVTVKAPAAGIVTNIAVVTSTTADANLGNNTSSPVLTSVTPVADVAIGKTGPANVLAASNLVYTISVTNFGPSSASAVVVTDSLPVTVTFVSASGGGINNSGVVNWSLGTLTNGQTSNVTVTVTAPASGSLSNVATVSTPTGDPNLTNNLTPPVITTVTPVADVAIGKTGSASVFAASNLVYTISVTNFGPSSASAVVVTDSLPVTVTFVSASGGGINNSGVVNWSLGILTNGQTSNVTVTVTAPASGSLSNVATVSTPTGDPNLTNNLTPPVITTVTPVADVAIGKTGPANVLAASNLVYTISVTNFGPSSASAVVVTDSLPVTVTFVSASGGGINNSGVVNWSLGILTNGQTSNVTVTVTAPASGSLSNVATVSTPTGDPNLTNNLTPPVITTVTPVADVAIGKTGPANVLAASNLVYTISVTNFGPSSASAVVVTDSLPVTVTFVSASGGGINNSGVVNWSLGILTNGQTSNVTVTVTAPASGSLSNVATVSTPTGDPNLTNNLTPPVITTVTPVADVAIGKTGPANVLAASNLVYTISVTNFGPSSASAVVVTDSLPVTVTFVSASGGGINNSGVVNWSLGILTNGQTSNVTVTVTAPASGSLSNVATVSTPTGDPNLTNNLTPPVITTVTPVADVAIGKTGPANVLAASNLVYTISVTNFGPSSASAVVVTDSLPVTVTFVSASGGGINNSGVVNWSLGILTNGQTSNVTVTVTAPASGSLSNVATVSTPTGDPNLTNNLTPPVITTVTPVADVAIGKTGSASVFAASNLVYTISVTNFGPSSASAVVVTDSLPVTVTFVSASGGGINNSGVVNWSLGILTNGQTSNVTVTVTAPASGSLSNVATVSTPTGDPNLTNNLTPPVITTVTPVADVAIGKTGSASVFAASNLVYTISVTNFGPSSASAVVVTDALPTGVTFVSASGGGLNNSGVVNWSLGILTNGQTSNVTVTVTAPASGSLSNVATVSTPTGDPNLTNNLTPPVITTVTPVTLVADLIVLLSGPTNVTVGDSFVYTIVVTNGGPSTASNIVVSNNLPAGLNFNSASAGGSFSNNVVNWPTIPALTNGGSTNFTIAITATNAGVFTNIASALSSTPDPNPTNNNGTSPASQVQTTVSSAQFALAASGKPVLNPQTGLFEESVTVTNIGSTTVAGVGLLVGGLPSNVTLYDAAGTNNGTPYVQYNYPLNPGDTVSFALEFYDPSLLPFTNSLTAFVIQPVYTNPLGTNGVFISQIFLDTRIAGDPRVVIGFPTTPGNTYLVLYSDDLITWQIATPSITANATATQWYDDGPPKTDSKPFSITSRFYRVILVLNP